MVSSFKVLLLAKVLGILSSEANKVIFQAVADFLLQVCSYVGDNLESICDEFIAEYTDDIIDQLVDKFLNPEEVCKAISACP